MLTDDEILEKYGKLAMWQAHRTARRFHYMPIEDAVQVALMTLIKCMRNKEESIKTVNYIRKSIDGQILTAARMMDFVPLPQQVWVMNGVMNRVYERLSKSNEKVTSAMMQLETGLLKATCDVYLEIKEADEVFFKSKYLDMDKSMDMPVSYQDRNKGDIEIVLSLLDNDESEILRDIYGINRDEMSVSEVAKKNRVSRECMYQRLERILSKARLLFKKAI